MVNNLLTYRNASEWINVGSEQTVNTKLKMYNTMIIIMFS